MKIDKALTRLISILPLKNNQDRCSPEIKKLHQAVLQSFVAQGHILNREEMLTYTSNIDEAVAVLKKYDMVVFAASGEATGAYPFTMDRREHVIQVNNHTVHAMCALDALAVSPMFNMDTKITSRCRVTNEVISISQSNTTINNLDDIPDVHFGIIWASVNTADSCANNLCMDMIFLRDAAIAQQWLTEDATNREIFNLVEAVEFSARFFVPLMSDGNAEDTLSLTS